MVSLAFVISFVASAIALIVGITIYSEVTDDLQKTLPVLDIESSATLGQGLANSDQPIAYGATNQASIYSGLNPFDQVTAVTVPISGVLLADGDEADITGFDRLPRGIYFSPDGFNLLVSGDNTDTISHYVLSPAWNIGDIQIGTNATSSYYIGEDDPVPQGLWATDDGSQLFVMGDGTDRILAYDLQSPFNVTNMTLVDTLDISGIDTSPRGLFMDYANDKLWFVGNDNDSVYFMECLVCSNPISNYNLASTVSVASEDTNPTGLFIKAGGGKMYVVGGSNVVYQYSLPTPYDILSYIYDDVSLNVSADPKGIAFKSDGSEIFAVRITP